MAPSRLRSAPRPAGKIGLDYQLDVASQIMAAGTQDVFVQPIVPLSGPGQGQIGVRVGRLLVYVANKEALTSFLDTWRQAEHWRTMPLDQIRHRRGWVNPSQPTGPRGLRQPAAVPRLPDTPDCGEVTIEAHQV